MAILVAALVVAAPSAVAQTPTQDQYESVPPGGDTLPTDDAGGAPDPGSGLAPDDDSGAAPVAVGNGSAGADRLPFTGGQISLVALIGLALLALGLLGAAASRRRGAPTHP